MENHKQCAKCRVFKLLSEFGADKTKKDRLKPYCKACMAIASSESFQRKIDKKVSDETALLREALQEAIKLLSDTARWVESPKTQQYINDKVVYFKSTLEKTQS